MSPRKPTTHVLIEGELTLAKRPRSNVWQCRYSVDGIWQHTSTGEYDLKLAKKRAHELLTEAKVRQRMNVPPITRLFKDVAKHALKRMEMEILAGNGKASYKDYRVAIEKYLIPALGRYKVDNIDYQALNTLNERRAQKLGKAPTRSTLLTHNSALQRVFDEAIYRGYMTESQRPKLEAKGKKTERRIEFSVEEVRAIKANFEAWISRGRADSKPIRELLRDYVEILLDTGARPGKELLDLKWVQIETKMYPVITKTDVVDEEGELIETVNANRTAFLKIQTGKTGARTAVGRVETVKALGRIAERNYSKPLWQLLEEDIKDNVFMYREVLSDKQIKQKVKPSLVKPTSFDKLFKSYLDTHNLLKDSATDKARSFYSLRHTYATLALTHDKVAIHTLAKQMGTSVGMIEKHYSHLEPVKAIHQLRGEETRQLINATSQVDKKYAFDETKEKKKRAPKKLK